jgi:RNA polymerase sigma factor (sigma-70 family)
MNGTDLLAEFREKRSEEAFRELVLRYTNLVFSAAQRRVSNASIAEEITQIVFIRLAKAAPKVGSDAELAAWLHRTTVHASIDLWRSEIRRRNRENYAVAMQTDPNETVPWNDLAPVLDDAVNELADTDRQAIVTRFFADKSMRDVGATLGVSEDAAKMRVSRALDRLRNLLGARGVSCGALGLAAMLAQHSVEAAPAHVAANLAALKIPVPATAGMSGAMVVSVASVILLGAGFWFFRQQTPITTPAQASAPVAEADAGRPPEGGTPNPVEVISAAGDPNPLQLLQAVARARERITSGMIEYYAFAETTYQGPRNTNHLGYAALFDGDKLRFESIGREYSYVGIGKAGEASAAKMKELGLTQEAAVQAGLLTPFESHHVMVFDDSVVMDYWKNHSTTIHDPSNGISNLHFDPRLLGITAHPRRGAVEKSLGYQDAQSVKLLGKELVEGTVAWHINVQSKHHWSPHFWLEVDRPTRVIKHTEGSDVVISRYEGNSPLPVEVMITITRHKSARRIVQTNAQFNIPVDPTSFTLAGLGMEIGTGVSDYRISRSIGYWTGAGLSKDPPPKGAKLAESPKLTELMALLEQNPTSHFAMDAAIWILLNTPDGPEVEKAADVIIQEHIETPELLELCKEQDRVRHRSSKRLLQAFLEKNPSAEIKEIACYTLATLLKDQAWYGLKKQTTAEAIKYFERLLREFPKSRQRLNAERGLYELRHLRIGSPAPETLGVDLNGQPLNLRDYRGKVVALYFWSSSYDNAEEHHDLVAAMADKPFALVSVNIHIGDLLRTRSTVEKHGITWPTVHDGHYGPIRSNWNVHTFPTTFVIDQNGIIRHRGNSFVSTRKEGQVHSVEETVNSLLP